MKTGVSLPADLLREIDEYMKTFGLRSRSKLLSEAVRSFMVERAWMTEKEREVIGVLIVIYNEKRGDTVRRLLDIQHDFLGDIVATTHFHISHEKCLEVILTKGRVGHVTELLSQIENVVGVEVARFVPVVLGK